MIAAFPKLRAFLKETTGIALDADKHYVVESRLSPLLRRFGESDIDSLVRRLESRADPDIARSIVEAMTTHETLFFRDRQPFDLFSNTILPHLMEARASERVIRIWCAGCATGQEPYSLAMLLDESARALAGWRVEILATDISRPALETARGALYNQFEVQRGLPVNLLLRYFNREDAGWRLVEHLRARVDFRELNLMEDFKGMGPFDVIFCRNVLIYFDEETKVDVLNRLADVTRSDGFLALGAAESVIGLGDEWRPHESGPGLNVRRQVQRPARTMPRLVSSN